MKRRTIVQAVLTLPFASLGNYAAAAAPKQLTGWSEVTSKRLDPAARDVEFLVPRTSWNIRALRLMPHGGGIWIDSVEAVTTGETVMTHDLKRRLLAGRYSEVLSFSQPVRSMRVRYTALPFADEALSLALHAMQG